jgi:D-alanyl-D-alanine carboxypeptidase
MTTTQLPQPALPVTLTQLGISLDMMLARGLTLYTEADQSLLITVATNEEGRQYQLLPNAAAAWHDMQAAAANDGYQLLVLSAYRSVARQIELIQHKLDDGININEILTSIAPPGYSEHHTGRAIDIAAKHHPELDESFATTAEYAWLTAHAGKFGFTLSYPLGNASGYVFEPWHWCWHEC